MRPVIAVTVHPEQLSDPDARRSYRHSIESAGGEAHLFFTEGGADRIAASLDGFDGLLLTGGGDVDPGIYGGRPHPALDPPNAKRDELELTAVRVARERGLPVFGICRGMQVMNVGLGGTLYEDVPDQFEPRGGLRLRHRQTPDFDRAEPTHEVDLVAGSRIAEILGSSCVRVNSLHHQAVRRLAHDLRAVGTTRDGLIEAIEARFESPFFLGVQWHPEEMHDRDGPARTLFAAFVAAAAAHASGPRPAGLAGPSVRQA